MKTIPGSLVEVASTFAGTTGCHFFIYDDWPRAVLTGAIAGGLLLLAQTVIAWVRRKRRFVHRSVC